MQPDQSVFPATHLKCNFKCELNYRNLLFLVFFVPNQCNYQCAGHSEYFIGTHPR